MNRSTNQSRHRPEHLTNERKIIFCNNDNSNCTKLQQGNYVVGGNNNKKLSCHRNSVMQPSYWKCLLYIIIPISLRRSRYNHTHREHALYIELLSTFSILFNPECKCRKRLSEEGSHFSVIWANLRHELDLPSGPPNSTANLRLEMTLTQE